MPTNPSQTGFRPYMKGNGTAVKVIRRRVASNNATAMFKYDCLRVTGAGVWGLAAAGTGFNGTSEGASYWDATINGRRENVYLPATTVYSSTAFDDYGNTDQSFLYITDDAVHTEFQCQYSASTPALTDLTKNANIVAGAGSTTTGISGHTLDQTTLNTTADLDVTIIDFKHNPFNDVTTAARAKVIVMINTGLLPPFNAAGTAGV
jgi:hypothetical protein